MAEGMDVAILDDDVQDDENVNVDFDGFENQNDGEIVDDGEWETTNKRKRKVSAENDQSTKRREVESELGTENVLSDTDLNDSIPSNQNILMNRGRSLGFTVTKTMKAIDGLTVIISPTGENSKSFTTNPVGLAQGLRNSPFESLVNPEIRVNRRANVVAFELKDADKNKIEALLQISKVGKWSVECYQPKNKRHPNRTCGVIRGVALSTELDELKEMMIMDNQCKILSVSRLPTFRSGSRANSLAIRIDFEETVLPSELKIGYMRYKVVPYESPPLRCYNCQRLGHKAENCTAQERCLLCAEPHNKNNCNKMEKDFKCANCNGNHPASSKKCEAIQNASKIQKLISQGHSFKQAKDLVMSQPTNHTSHMPIYSQNERVKTNITREHQLPIAANQLNTVIVEADVENTQGSYFPITQSRPLYSQIVRNDSYYAGESFFDTQTQTVTVTNTEREDTASRSRNLGGAQQDNTVNVDEGQILKIFSEKIMPSIINTITECLEKAVNKIYENVSKLFLEVIGSKINAESTLQRKLLLLNMIRNTLGAEVSNPILNEMNIEREKDQRNKTKKLAKNQSQRNQCLSDADSDPESEGEQMADHAPSSAQTKKDHKNKVKKSTKNQSQRNQCLSDSDSDTESEEEQIADQAPTTALSSRIPRSTNVSTQSHNSKKNNSDKRQRRNSPYNTRNITTREKKIHASKKQ